MHPNNMERFGPIVVLCLCNITEWRRRTCFGSFAFLTICCSGFLQKSAALPADSPGPAARHGGHFLQHSASGRCYHSQLGSGGQQGHRADRGCFWACGGCRGWGLMALTLPHGGQQAPWPQGRVWPAGSGCLSPHHPLLQHRCHQPPQTLYIAVPLSGNLLFSEASHPSAVRK